MAMQMAALDSRMKELRAFLGLTQKQMSSVLSCSVHSLLSIELGRMKLSPRMALKVVRATGISRDWLTGDLSEMLNEYGEPYTLKDFEECRERDETMEFYLAVEEMEILVAADLLFRVYKEVRAKPAMQAMQALPKFSHDLRDFVRTQVAKFHELKVQVEKENVERNKRQKRVRPYLFPAGLEGFKRVRKKTNEAIAAFVDREKRMASRS